MHMQIDQFDNEQKFLYAIKGKKYDLVFLDIFMNRIEGDRVARYVREQWANCQIIFTTASREHAVEAFKVRALDYLVKPYTYENLAGAMAGSRKCMIISFITLTEGRPAVYKDPDH